MGFFGGDNDQSRGEQLAQEQLESNRAELEAKKQNLYQTRLDIIKSQGGQTWAANRNKRAPADRGNGGFPFGGGGFLNS